ncbi:hypothetical protein RCO27_00680 [Sphingosinicella sp. LHD-64]|uniref:hypothetical protein n=1 Tax=Sphingosinicella sp. LHD-64 TaxID=3072139 RepID=UPI00281083E1|nr:hypothetical protein [Sphingosinicella sp. LHD-64]MDQ8754731.1 hypothetical protein [Sphingosinicella sp. LHD-64]
MMQPMELNMAENEERFVFLPSVTGDGVLVKRTQVVGARPNGPNGGAIVYTAAGPSIYTSLPTTQLARLFDAQLIEAAH